MNNMEQNNNREVLLRVENLCQYFKIGKKELRAVDNVSFDIYKGEVFGLVGESGCGKTTTGRSIIRLYDITGGSVYYKGERICAGTRSYKQAIVKAKKDFSNGVITQEELEKIVDENRAELPIQETYEHSMMKDGYAARDIETAVKMLIVQAEHRAREAGALGKDETFNNADQILLEVFKAATEPAVEKSVMLLKQKVKVEL